MFRAGIAVAALTALVAAATPASAQPILPLSNAPGIVPFPVPASAIPQRPGPGAPNTVFFPVAMPWGWGVGWGYQTYNPWTGFGYNYGGLIPPEGFEAPPPPQPVAVFPRRREPTVVLANEFPATLTIQFPAAAEVWLNEKKVAGKPTEEQTLTSPVLKPDQTYTFLVKARWTSGGKTYETKRAVTLGSGSRSRLLVISGDEVKE
jgi:uncharacterized protein (TIGR03000 family)